MTRRDGLMVILLTIVTCGIYYLYWQYVTTEELAQVSAREDLNPMLDLIITLVCCGVYTIYVQYRNTQVVHEVLVQAGRQHEDKSAMVLVMHILNFFVGFTALIAIYVAQDELNKLVDVGGAPSPHAF